MSRFDPANVDVEHFLDTLGIENITKATQSEFRFSCPFVINHSGGDETPSCYMNMNSGAFFCHGCKEKGTAVDMAAYVLQISPLESVRLLRSAYQPGGINPDARDMIAEVKKILAPVQKIEQPHLPAEMIENYAMDWRAAYEAWLANDGTSFPPADYFFGRGFLPDTLTGWGFGWDDRSKRVVFPVFDEKSRLIGFKGRATDGRKPKYLVLGDGPNGGPYGFPRYYPSMVVFGAHRWPEGTSDLLVVCEGELNAIATRQKMRCPAVAINGSYFQPWHAQIIRKIANAGVVLFLDDDEAGNNCTWGHYNAKGEWRPGIVELLQPHMPVLLAPAKDKDAADMSEQEIRAHLASAEDSLLVQIR
jgi:DNA primase